jgi:hypothetical protein
MVRWSTDEFGHCVGLTVNAVDLFQSGYATQLDDWQVLPTLRVADDETESCSSLSLDGCLWRCARTTGRSLASRLESRHRIPRTNAIVDAPRNGSRGFGETLATAGPLQCVGRTSFLNPSGETRRGVFKPPFHRQAPSREDCREANTNRISSLVRQWTCGTPSALAFWGQIPRVSERQWAFHGRDSARKKPWRPLEEGPILT